MSIGHDRKTVYHSDLRNACEAAPKGRIRIRLLGKHARVLDSRFKNKGPYAPFVVDGEDLEREYQVENDSIRELLNAAPEGEPVWIQATGGPSHEAIRLWRADGTPITLGEEPAAARQAPTPEPEPEPVRTEAGPGAPSQNGRGNGGGGAVRHFDRKTPLSHEIWAAYVTAHEIIQAYEDTYGYPPSPAVGALASTLFIEYQKAGASRPFSAHALRKPGDRSGLDPNRRVGYRPWEEESAAPAPATTRAPERDELPPTPPLFPRRRDAVAAMASSAAGRSLDFDDDELPF